MSQPIQLTSHDVREIAPAAPAAAARESNVPFGNFISYPGLGLFAGDSSLQSRYGGFWPADRVQLPNHAPPGVLTEFQHRAMIAWSRWLLQYNGLAVGFCEQVCNFIGETTVGFTPRGGAAQAVADGGQDDHPDVRLATEFWEEFCEANQWGPLYLQDREAEARTRFLRDSERIVRLGRGRSGTPWLRFVEPEQVRQPGNPPADWPAADWRWGVATRPGDGDGDVIGLAVADFDGGGGTFEYLTPDQFVFDKDNTDRVLKRGFPSFSPVEEQLQVTKGLIDNTGQTSKSLSAIAWIEQYATATPEQIRTVLAAGADYTATFGQYPPTGGGTPQTPLGYPRTLPVRSNPAGTVIYADQNRQYNPGPTLAGVPGFIQVVDNTMKAVGWRFGIPDWFTQGAQAFAAALVTGSPFARAIESRQKRACGFTREVVIKAMRLAEQSGRLPVGLHERVKVLVTARPVVIADEQKQSSVDDMRLRNNLIDPQTLIREAGHDPRVVLANIKAWRAETAALQQPPPGGPVPGAQDAEPAPPGSSGGDGGDPLAALESEWVQEGFTGTIKDKAGRERHYVNGKQVAKAHVDSKRAAHADVEAAVSAAVADPSKVTPAGLKALAGHLQTLTKDKLQAMARDLRAKAGGTKTQLADRLLATLQERRGKGPEPVASKGKKKTTSYKNFKPKLWVPKASANSPQQPTGTTAELLKSESLAPVSHKIDVTDGDDAIVRSHVADLSMVPANVHKRVADKLGGVYVGSKPVTGLDSMGRLAGERPRGWAEGNTWDKVAGLYDAGVRKVVAGSGSHASASVIQHEYGHAVDDITGVSDTQEFKDWHTKIYPGLDWYMQQDGPGGRAGCEELFAESFAVLHRKGVSALAGWSGSSEYADWFKGMISKL